MSDIFGGLPQEKIATRIENLNLPIRPYRSLQRAGIYFIEQLLRLHPDKLLGVRNLGTQSYDIILDATSKYLKIPKQDLQGFLESNDAESSIELKLSSKIAELPVSVLDLSSRPADALKNNDIETLQELFDAQCKGFLGLRGIDEKAREEISDKFKDFLERADDSTIDELEGIKDRRPFFIDVVAEPPNLVELIELIAKRLLFALDKKRDFEVLKRRYGLEGSQAYTLQQVGDYYGPTRQRIEQIEARALNSIRDLLLGDCQLKDWRLPESLIREVQELTTLLCASDKVLTEPKIFSLLSNRYNTNFSSKDTNSLTLLLDILGFRRLASTAVGIAQIDKYSAWIMNQDVQKRTIYAAIRSVRGVLRDAGLAMSLFDIMVQVNHRRKRKITIEDVKLAIEICREIEEISDDLYQIKLEYLPSAADKAYRILSEQNKPLHSREILRTINHKLVKSGKSAIQPRSLTGQLAADSRFEPIGRSGEWSLAKWDICRDIIVDIIEECFHFQGEVISVQQIHEYVISKRPGISKDAIAVYLAGHKDKFVRVDSGKYGLVVWGTKPAAQANPPAQTTQQVNDLLNMHIPKIFEDAGVDEMPLSELVQESVIRTELKKVTVYSALRRLQVIETFPDPENKRKKIAKYKKDTQVTTHIRRTKREAIQEEIEAFLKGQPGGCALVADVDDHIVETLHYKKGILYSYLPAIRSVKQTKIGDRLYCSLLIEDEERSLLSFPRIEDVADKSTRGNLLRAIRHLTVEDVDIGLFQLGKMLETELKAFLLAVQSQGVFSVTRNDISRLVCMIDCVERNGVVKNKHHLTLLREERNERAHGDIPSLSEREDLMRQAPFLAGLFIDYIVFFHNKRIEIE